MFTAMKDKLYNCFKLLKMLFFFLIKRKNEILTTIPQKFYHQYSLNPTLREVVNN